MFLSRGLAPSPSTCSGPLGTIPTFHWGLNQHHITIKIRHGLVRFLVFVLLVAWIGLNELTPKISSKSGFKADFWLPGAINKNKIWQRMFQHRTKKQCYFWKKQKNFFRLLVSFAGNWILLNYAKLLVCSQTEQDQHRSVAENLC